MACWVELPCWAVAIELMTPKASVAAAIVQKTHRMKSSLYHRLARALPIATKGTDSKGVRPILHERSKGRFDLAAIFGFENIDVPPDRPCRRFRVLDHILCGNRICRIDKERDPSGARCQLVQETQPFGTQFGSHVIDACDICARAAEACHDTGFYRIGTGGKDYGNGGGGRFRCKGCYCADRRDNHRHLTLH